MRLDHVNIVVSDMERAIHFYSDILGLTRGFETLLEGEWIDRVTGISGVRARCVFFEFPDGGSRIELLQYLSPIGETLSPNEMANTIGVRHVAFEVREMDAFLRKLKESGARFLSDPEETPFIVGNVGRKKVCYFYDPDGVLLEFASYEK